MSETIETTEKVEQYSKGYKLEVSSTRGTGTRDQDKIKGTARAETLEDLAVERAKLTANVKAAMEDMREFNPEEGE